MACDISRINSAYKQGFNKSPCTVEGDFHGFLIYVYEWVYPDHLMPLISLRGNFFQSKEHFLGIMLTDLVIKEIDPRTREWFSKIPEKLLQPLSLDEAVTYAELSDEAYTAFISGYQNINLFPDLELRGMAIRKSAIAIAKPIKDDEEFLLAMEGLRKKCGVKAVHRAIYERSPPLFEYWRAIHPEFFSHDDSF